MKFHPSIVQGRCESPLGAVILAATSNGLAGLWFAKDQRHMPDTHSWPEAASSDPANAVMRDAASQLASYFAGRTSIFDMPLDLQSGTEFQQAVWRALLEIPHGETTSYGAISRQIGQPAAVRAVGAAVGRNPISIIVPCHRVVGSAGALTGYAGGLPRKRALLELEGAVGFNTELAL